MRPISHLQRVLASTWWQAADMPVAAVSVHAFDANAIAPCMLDVRMQPQNVSSETVPALSAVLDFDAAAYGPEYASLRRGDFVDVLEVDEEWAYGRVRGCFAGWFPTSYVGNTSSLSVESHATDKLLAATVAAVTAAVGTSAVITDSECVVIALQDFDANPFGEGYVELRRGDCVKVIDAPDGEADEDWTYGRVSGRGAGWFPSSHITPPRLTQRTGGDPSVAEANGNLDCRSGSAPRGPAVLSQPNHMLLADTWVEAANTTDGLPTTPLVGRAQQLPPKSITDILTRHNRAVGRLGVKYSEDFSFRGLLMHCYLTWQGPSGRTRSEGLGKTKREARAAAALVMIEEHGGEAHIDAADREAALQLHAELVQPTHGAIRVLYERSAALAHSTSPPVWSIYFPNLMEAAMGSRDIDAVLPLLVNLEGICDQRLSVETWERMVDAAGLCTEAALASAALRKLTSGLRCDAEVFPTCQGLAVFQSFRAWLACEGQAQLRQIFDRQSSHVEVAMSLQLVDRAQSLVVLIAPVASELPSEGEFIMIAPQGAGGGVAWTVAQVKSVKARKDFRRALSARPFATTASWWDGAEVWWKVGAVIAAHPLEAFGVVHNRMVAALLGVTGCGLAASGDEASFCRELCDLILLGMDTTDLPRAQGRAVEAPGVDTCLVNEICAPPFSEKLAEFSVELTSAQQRAVDRALTCRVSCVQGPPGTGKTATAVAIVRAWRRTLLGNILCCADSNAAADNLVRALLARGIMCVRVGRGSDFEMQEHMHKLPGYLEYVKAKRGLPGQEIFQRMKLEKQGLHAYGVAVSTCSGIGHSTWEKVAFPLVVVDECTQSILPSALVPISQGAERIVLLGDEKQLPPTILHEEAAHAGFQRSLFERLVAGRPDWAVLLDVQWRMHPSIAEFPLREFYGGRVTSHDSCLERVPVEGFAWPASGVRVLCVDVQGWEESAGMSRQNPLEADAIVQLLTRVTLRPQDIGVITPYKGQVKLLRRMLQKAGFGTVCVDTVDGFQGSERELILFSAVRCNCGGRMGFVTDCRRMNVALTRARIGLIVVASRRTLEASGSRNTAIGSGHSDREAWGRWLRWAGAAEAIVQSVGESVDSAEGECHGREEVVLTPRGEATLAAAVRAVCASVGEHSIGASTPLNFTRECLYDCGIRSVAQLVGLVDKCTDDDWCALAPRPGLPVEVLRELRAAVEARQACGHVPLQASLDSTAGEARSALERAARATRTKEVVAVQLVISDPRVVKEDFARSSVAASSDDDLERWARFYPIDRLKRLLIKD